MKSVLFVILTLISCNSTNLKQDKVMSYEVVIQGLTGGKQTREMMVINDEQLLQKVYDRLNATREPGYAIPHIDFEKEQVICLFMGEHTTGGFKIEVDRVSQTDKQVTVYYKETSPGPQDMVTMAITQPFCIVKIERVNKPIKFEASE